MQDASSPEMDFSVIETMVRAIEQGDMEALRTCFTPDARVWHNYDGVELDVDGTIAGLASLCEQSHRRTYEKRRMTTVGRLAFLQHTLAVELDSGKRMELVAAMRVEIGPEGLISRIEEYFDSRALDVLGP